MSLIGDKVILSPITSDDTELVLKWRNSDKVRGQFIFRQTITYEMHMDWLKNEVNTGKCAQFIISERNTGFQIGTTYLRDINKTHNNAEFGIYLGEESSYGKGYGSEATRLIIQYGFKNLCLHRIFLRVLSGNDRAIKTYIKTGFIEEGTLRDDVYLDGNYHDVILMGMLNEKDLVSE